MTGERLGSPDDPVPLALTWHRVEAADVDSNVDRAVETRLQAYGHRAELVVDELEPGSDDHSGVLPYARREGLIVVTKDVSDFGGLDSDAHEGVVLVFDDGLDGEAMIRGIRRIVGAYPGT